MQSIKLKTKGKEGKKQYGEIKERVNNRKSKTQGESDEVKTSKDICSMLQVHLTLVTLWMKEEFPSLLVTFTLSVCVLGFRISILFYMRTCSKFI